MCLKQKCVSSLICLFMLPWLVLCVISCTVQTVTYCNDSNQKSHPFSLSDTCYDKPYVPWIDGFTNLVSGQVPLSEGQSHAVGV